MIESLRFQIEFNFRHAKQYWGLQDFMNVNKIPVINLSMFMVSVSAKLTDTFRCPNTEFSVDLKARYRGAKYLHETLKILPKKPDTIVIEQIAQRLGSIGAIHQTQQKLNIIGEGIASFNLFKLGLHNGIYQFVHVIYLPKPILSAPKVLVYYSNT